MARPSKAAMSEAETPDALRHKADSIRQFAYLLTPKTRAAALLKAGQLQQRADSMERESPRRDP